MGIIASTHAAKCGHPGGSMSAADMLTYLYNKEMGMAKKAKGIAFSLPVSDVAGLAPKILPEAETEE